MRYILKTRFFNIRMSKLLLLLPVICVFLTACETSVRSKELDAKSSQYSTEALAKDWREQVRKNPKNPYEGRNYPADNDSEYMPVKKNPRGSYRADEEDTGYGKFPRYNPDDDNMPMDPKNYPLYLY